MNQVDDTAADELEQHNIFIALNNAIPTPISYRNLLIALTELTAEVVRIRLKKPEDHAQVEP